MSSSKNKIQSLRINRLVGRVYKSENTKSKKQILLVSGVGGSIENTEGLIKILSRIGNVVRPDMPGIGGMTSFYSIGRKPNIKAYADYLRAFTKLRYKKTNKITVVTIGEGLLFVTKLLIDYPDLQKNIKTVVSIGGIVHKNDLKVSPSKKLLIKIAPKLHNIKFLDWMAKILIINTPIIYKFVHGNNQNERNFAVNMWRESNLRTRLFLENELTKTDLCNSPINTPLHYMFGPLVLPTNKYSIKHHLPVVYKNFNLIKTKKDINSCLVFANEKLLPKYIAASVWRNVL